MRYVVLQRGLGSHGAIELTAREFEEIGIAKRGFLLALGIEEKFHLLLENFAEFEAELLNLSLQHLVFADISWSSFQGDIYTVNRRLVNLLSSTRLYIDHLLHELTASYGSASGIVSATKARLASEYDSSLSFRTIDVIRNHLQHRSLPVDGVKHTASRDESEDAVSVRHNASPRLNILELRADPKVKQSVVAELATLGNEVCVTPLVREYVEAIGRVDEGVRAAMASDVGRWDSQMSAWVERAKTVFGNAAGLAAVRIGADDQERNAEDLFLAFIDRRRLLEQRSRHAAHLANHYVTGKANLDDV